jgi:potassium voltage-gated channel Eag-related subfamily H protein 8
MLKYISKLVVDPLIYIYNLNIEQSIFSDTLKVADVKPLFKSGDKSIMSNYRPISMLSNFSKIFEKIIKARLIEFLEKNNLLSKNQYGFRPGLSTENALYKVTQFIYSNLDNSNKSLVIF